MSALPPKADINPHGLECLLLAISGHFYKAAGYDMLSADNMVCRSNGSNYETVIVSLDHNSIWD
jgi:hypothetical protein